MSEIRKFDTGAIRDVDTNKYDYEGFLSPLVLDRFAQYMHKHRIQPDGNKRDSDNWQKGIPKTTYMKSGWRHFMDWWRQHRGLKGQDLLEESICALLFNAMGYLHEILKEKLNENRKPDSGVRRVPDAEIVPAEHVRGTEHRHGTGSCDRGCAFSG